MANLKKIISLALVCTMLISTVACLGGVFTFGAAAADPVYTDYAGNTFAIGEKGQVKTVSEMSAAYDSKYGTGTLTGNDTTGIGTKGWTYLASKSYEVPAADYQKYDILKNATPTDGYVKKGDYIFTTVTYASSSGVYLGLPTFVFGFSWDFFDFVVAPLSTTTAVLSATNKGDANQDIEKTACRMNQDNGMCNGNVTDNNGNAVGLYYKITTKTATENDIAGNRTLTGLSSAQLQQIGAFQFSAFFTAATVYPSDGSTWMTGFLLKVKNDDSMTDGKMGAIFCPSEFYKTAAKAGRFGSNKVAYSPATPYNNAKLDSVNTTLTFITEDFGCGFIIGDPKPAVTYTATFKNGDETVSTVTDLVTGGTVNAPAEDPEAPEGMSFAGWGTTADNLDSKVKFPYTVGEADLTFYALFSEIPQHNVTFINPKTNETIDTDTVAEGAEYTIGTETDPEYEGYSFQGWTTVADDETTKVSGTVEMGTADAVYYALFTINQYKVTFDANGGSFADGVDNFYSDDFGKDIVAIEAEPTRKGYEFLGWALANNATAAAESLGTIPSREKTVYAVWKANSYTIYLYASKDAEDYFTKLTATFDQTAPTVTATTVDGAKPGVGYAFDKWYFKADDALASAAKINPLGAGTKYTTDADVSIYATWSEIPVVTFNVSDGNNFVEAAKYDTSSTINWADLLTAAKAKAAESGVEYTSATLGWYSDEALTTKAFGTDGKISSSSSFSIKTVTENTNFYLGKANAKATITIGEGENAYTVTSADGKLEGDKTAFKIDRTKADAAAPFGSKFDGIYDAADESKTIIAPVNESGNNIYYALEPGNHTYEAAFAELDLTITVNLKIDGKAIASADVELDDAVSLDTAFTAVDESKPVPAIGDELKNFNKAGNKLVDWKSLTSDITLSTGFTVDEALLKSNAALKQGEGAYEINLEYVVEKMSYTATFTITDGGVFSKTGNSTETLTVEADTPFNNIKTLVADEFGDVVCEGRIVSTWDYDHTISETGKMPAQDFTYTIVTESLAFKARYIINSDEDGQVISSMEIDTYFGDPSEDLYNTELEITRWKNYNFFKGWKLIEGEFADDGTVIGPVTFTADYDPFSNYLLILYNSNVKSADVPLTTGSSSNPNIYMTLSKKLKITYWKDGQPVSRKDTKCNLGEGTFILFYLLKFVGKNDGGFYITACPFTLPLSIFDPREIADTFQLLITAIKSLL